MTAALLIISTGCTVGQNRRTYDQQREAYLRKCLDIAAENVANANTNAEVNGLNNPYRRKVVQWHAASRSWSVVEDVSPFPKRFEPGHPLADTTGFVRYPNVVVSDEAADVDAAVQELQRLRAARPGT